MAVVVAGCLDVAEPVAVGEAVLVSGGDSARLAVVDIVQGRIVASTAPLPRYQDAWARSPDGSTMYASAFDQIPSRQLIALDVASLRTVWQEAVAAIASRSRIGSITISGNYALSVSPDGTRLLLADAVRDNVLGLAALDATTRDPVAFFGPIAVAPSGTAILLPTPSVPDGGILVAGSRPDTVPSIAQLLVLDAVTLAVRDSVTLQANVNARRGGLSQIVPSPDHRHVYVVGLDNLYRYDLTAHAVTATAPRLGTGNLAISLDGQRLYLTDAGDGRFSPGSGRIFVYDSALTQLPSIDLSAAAVNGVAPVTTSLVVSRTGEHLHVLSGTPYIGPLYGTQLGRVLVVDVATRRLARQIALGEYGTQWIFLR